MLARRPVGVSPTICGKAKVTQSDVLGHGCHRKTSSTGKGPVVGYPVALRVGLILGLACLPEGAKVLGERSLES